MKFSLLSDEARTVIPPKGSAGSSLQAEVKAVVASTAQSRQIVRPTIDNNCCHHLLELNEARTHSDLTTVKTARSASVIGREPCVSGFIATSTVDARSTTVDPRRTSNSLVNEDVPTRETHDRAT